MHKIDWCEVAMQLTYIATNNVGENYLNNRLKYIMVRLENYGLHFYKRGDRI